MPQGTGAVGHIGEEWVDEFRLNGMQTGSLKISHSKKINDTGCLGNGNVGKAL